MNCNYRYCCKEIKYGRPDRKFCNKNCKSKEKAIEKEFKALNRKSKKSKDFIIKSSKIHNNKYNYDLVLYENCRTKVKIECQVHGVFEQTPDAHQYSERGCEKCAREARRKTQINEQSD
jgi:hypothetical protein